MRQLINESIVLIACDCLFTPAAAAELQIGKGDGRGTYAHFCQLSDGEENTLPDQTLVDEIDEYGKRSQLGSSPDALQPRRFQQLPAQEGKLAKSRGFADPVDIIG
jgi:hypothetical protein